MAIWVESSDSQPQVGTHPVLTMNTQPKQVSTKQHVIRGRMGVLFLYETKMVVFLRWIDSNKLM